MNTITATVEVADGVTCVRLADALIPLPDAEARAVEAAADPQVVVGVRPEHLEIAPDGVVVGTVTVIESLGHERHIVCRLANGEMVIVRQDSDDPAPRLDEPIRLVTDPEHLHLFSAATEQRIEP